MFGFFTGQFIFTVDTSTVSATVGTGGGVNSLVGAQLTTLSLELDGSDVTIGPASGPHLVIHDGTKLAVAVLKPATPAVGATFSDTRAWIGLKATDVGASLEGIDGLEIAVTGGSFQFNSASGAHDDNGATAGGTITNATALNWATALGTAPTVGTQTINLDGQLLSLAGTATIDVFGFFTGQFAFTVLMRNVDVDLGGAAGAELINASLVTLSLTVVTNPVTIGEGGVGFTVGVGSSVAVAVLTAPVATAPATDNRKWTALRVGLSNASLTAAENLTINNINGTFELNNATGQLDSNGATAGGVLTAATALDWRHALDLDDDGVFSENDDPTTETTDDVLLVGTQTIALSGSGMRVSGSASFDVFGILTGSASFALSNRLVDVDLDGVAGGETLDNAALTLIAVSNINLSFGTADAGLTIGPGGTIGIAILKAPVTATDTRTWTAIVAKNLAITPNLPLISGQIVNGSLKINRVSGAKSGTALTDADALNWATVDGLPLTVDLNEAGGWTAPTALVDPGAALPTPTFLPVTLRGAQTAVAGTLQNLDIFGFVTGGANFAMQSRTVDVDLDGTGDTSGDQLNDATLLTIALDQLNLSIGAAGAGLAVTSGRLGIAILTAPKTATDNRSWLALSASNLGITLSIPGITATVTNGSVLLNRASGAKDTIANTTELNWVTIEGGNQNGLIDFNSAGTYTTNLSELVDPGAALSPPVAMPVTVRGEQMAVSGSLTNLNVFDIITGSANFALVTTQVDVDLDGIAGGETLNDATLLTLGLSSLNLSVGAGGTGLAITGGKVGIATIKAPLPTTVGATDTRSWTAITAKDLVISLSLPAGVISATVTNVTLKINKAAGQFQAPTPQGGTAPAPVLATSLNWATAGATPAALTVDLDAAGGWTAPTQLVDPGQALPTPDPMPITLRGEQLAVAGSLTNISIFSFITGSADFEISTGSIVIDLPTGQQDPVNASLLTFGLNNLNLTVGDPNGLRFVITNGSLALAIAKAGAPADALKGDTRTWMALKGSVSATIEGQPEGLGLTLKQPERRGQPRQRRLRPHQGERHERRRAGGGRAQLADPDQPRQRHRRRARTRPTAS